MSKQKQPDPALVLAIRKAVRKYGFKRLKKRHINAEVETLWDLSRGDLVEELADYMLNGPSGLAPKGLNAMTKDELVAELAATHDRVADFDDWLDNSVLTDEEVAARYRLLLVQRWAEPESGSYAWLIELQPEEEKVARELVKWQTKHAGKGLGSELSRFTWKPLRKKDVEGEADIQGLDAFVLMFATESRYEETEKPGEFYGERNATLDTLLAKAKQNPR